MARTRRLRIAAVEPYFGGSHAHFLGDLQRFCTAQIELFTLPARHWKWRVRGAALSLAPALAAARRRGFDVLLCSDFVNVADLRALLPPALRTVPVLYYLHENQLTYPLSPAEEFDPYFGFTNVLSCLSAEAVAFNSDFHRREFLARLPKFLPRLPDYDRKAVVESITAKAEVLPVGLDVAEITAPARRSRNSVPRILWNHRWEFDKQPDVFFAALEGLAAEAVPFIVDVLGESFARRPPVFDTIQERLGERVGHFGTVASRADYLRRVGKADIVVSTARQEFFGISMAEAVLCGAHPIAPRRLVYTDLYDGPCARLHLYRDEADLVRLLRRELATPHSHPCGLADRYRALDWRHVAPLFDARFEALAAGGKPHRSRTPLGAAHKPLAARARAGSNAGG